MFLDGRIDAVKYKNTLEESILPFAAVPHGTDWIFQQDNAPIHRAFHSHRYLHDNGIVVFPWPSRSPNLNPIEKVWSILGRRVYVNFHQFGSVAELTIALEKCWEDIDDQILQMLYESMPRRIKDVIRAHGRSMKY